MIDHDLGDESKAGSLYQNKNNDVAHIVIVGASHAGVSFADQIRKKGFNGNLETGFLLLESERTGSTKMECTTSQRKTL